MLTALTPTPVTSDQAEFGNPWRARPRLISYLGPLTPAAILLSVNNDAFCKLIGAFS
jgi:hypothetical protein